MSDKMLKNPDVKKVLRFKTKAGYDALVVEYHSFIGHQLMGYVCVDKDHVCFNAVVFDYVIHTKLLADNIVKSEHSKLEEAYSSCDTYSHDGGNQDQSEKRQTH